MRDYEKILTVVQGDLDELDHVNNVRYVQWIQDVSREHWRRKAPKTIRDTVVWVVMRHDIVYKNAARLNDRIRIRTYIEKSHGATSVRVVEMKNDVTNALLVRSSTEWCLLNADTLRPQRISQQIVEVFGQGAPKS